MTDHTAMREVRCNCGRVTAIIPSNFVTAALRCWECPADPPKLKLVPALPTDPNTRAWLGIEPQFTEEET